MGVRVRVRRASWPLEAGVEGREGRVTEASEYRPHRYGVLLDGEQGARYFRPEELEALEAMELPPEREAAKRLRALP
jgi:hypothetical protein